MRQPALSMRHSTRRTAASPLRVLKRKFIPKPSPYSSGNGSGTLMSRSRAAHSAASARLRFTRTDHVVNTQVVQASEAVSADLPGDLAAAAGRLLRRLANDGLTRAASDR
jgi:hypothetical protein